MLILILIVCWQLQPVLQAKQNTNGGVHSPVFQNRPTSTNNLNYFKT